MEFTGKTVQEAIELGLKELNVAEADAVIEIIEEPTKGLFGKLKGKAVVKIEKKATGNEKATEFVQKIIDIMDITAKAELSFNEEKPVITIIAEKSQEIIGYRGEVLDAIQTLASAIANVGSKDYKKVTVDCENYREKREETLIALAHKLEAKAVELKRDVILEPMNPFERRIIHTALAESQVVKTASEGKEPNRYVVITPNEKDEFSTPYNAGRNENKKGYNDRKGKKFNKKDRKFGKKSGFTDEIRKKPSGFGTYLGNSLKDKI
ncbi:MAG: protein jag [Clostridia bacterium]|nr:protein jag [Clostridia bacterium]